MSESQAARYRRTPHLHGHRIGAPDLPLRRCMRLSRILVFEKTRLHDNANGIDQFAVGSRNENVGCARTMIGAWGRHKEARHWHWSLRDQTRHRPREQCARCREVIKVVHLELVDRSGRERDGSGPGRIRPLVHPAINDELSIHPQAAAIVRRGLEGVGASDRCLDAPHPAHAEVIVGDSGHRDARGPVELDVGINASERRALHREVRPILGIQTERTIRAHRDVVERGETYRPSRIHGLRHDAMRASAR